MRPVQRPHQFGEDLNQTKAALAFNCASENTVFNIQPSDYATIALIVADDGPDPTKKKRKAWALDIWSKSVDATGTIAKRYLVEHRGPGGNVRSSVVRCQVRP
jgi:hypothetical protein